MGYLISIMLKGPSQYISHYHAPAKPYVGMLIGGWAAGIYPDLALRDRLKRLLSPCKRVKKP